MSDFYVSDIHPCCVAVTHSFILFFFSCPFLSSLPSPYRTPKPPQNQVFICQSSLKQLPQQNSIRRICCCLFFPPLFHFILISLWYLPQGWFVKLSIPREPECTLNSCRPPFFIHTWKQQVYIDHMLHTGLCTWIL